MDFPSLSQLKVADLKQHLKQRGLSIVGNKSDLINRLGTAMLKESSLNSSVSTVNIPSIPQNQNINNKDPSKVEIDEDAILGDDDDTPSIIGKHDTDAFIQNEDLLLSETSTIVTPSIIKSSNTNDSTAPKTATRYIMPNTTPNSPSNLDGNLQLSTTFKSIPPLKQLIKNKHPLTSEERKRLRMIKFADPKLINRAERFGITSKGLQPTEEGKLLKRIQRFGEVISTKAKTLDERERLERRKERFGTTVNNKSSNKDSISENIRKRQERFGVVDKTANGGNNIFKKRFAI